MNKPKLAVVSVPIGNQLDISLRAIANLKECDFVIGEEFTETSKFLKINSIKKEFELYNEHSTKEDLARLVAKIKTETLVCLISDSGTPTLEDPGQKFVSAAIRNGIEVDIIPGSSALLVALSLSGFSTSPFTFAGFLPRENETRLKSLKKFLSLNHTLVIYETPYRYKKVIVEISKIVNPKKKIFLGLNLTCPDQFVFRGEIKSALAILDKLPKAPPVIILSEEK